MNRNQKNYILWINIYKGVKLEIVVNASLMTQHSAKEEVNDRGRLSVNEICSSEK